MEFSRQDYRSGLPSPSPRVLLNPGIKPGSPALQVDYLLSEPGKPSSLMVIHLQCTSVHMSVPNSLTIPPPNHRILVRNGNSCSYIETYKGSCVEGYRTMQLVTELKSQKVISIPFSCLYSYQIAHLP